MPNYKLDNVRRVVRNGEVRFHGRKAQRDMYNLGYEINDVKSCLLSLTDSDFHKSHNYNGRGFDAYVVTFNTDQLYVKFCLMGDYLYINVGSFHLTN